MAEGSSSAAPVINPSPRTLSRLRLPGLGWPDCSSTSTRCLLSLSMSGAREAETWPSGEHGRTDANVNTRREVCQRLNGASLSPASSDHGFVQPQHFGVAQGPGFVLHVGTGE